jgi:Dolichyl-phosphate-mannose-protein mannosyltransferase
MRQGHRPPAACDLTPAAGGRRPGAAVDPVTIAAMAGVVRHSWVKLGAAAESVPTRLMSGGRWVNLLVPLAIFGVAGWLRFWNLDHVGFRGDEAVYSGQAAVLAGVHPMERHFILVSRGNSNFLLYQYILSLVYRLLGVDDVAPRVVAATFSVLIVLVTMWVAWVLYGRLTAWLAALLMAVSSYAVSLGRLALLDSTITFLFTLAVLCLVKWQRTKKPLWMYGLAGVTSFAIQTKLVGVLIFPICIAYLLLSRSMGLARWRHIAVSGGVFLVCLLPALLQLSQGLQEFVDLLSHSTRRISDVPWYYYPRLLVRYEGPVMPVIWAVGVLLALKRRSQPDLLLLIWLVVVLAFFQLYSLKAFNYLLPLVPALVCLGARALSALVRWPIRQWPVRRMAAAGAAAVALTGFAVPSLHSALADDSFGGLKEAAQWLSRNSPAEAGVMTMSGGSAQYVFSFYANRDSYPYGRFQLATVLPGGTVVPPTHTEQGTPRDWVTYWPAKLIESGTVSYLVYYTNNPGQVDADDEPSSQGPIDQTARQHMFKRLIERYSGELVYTGYRNHTARVWIYRVTKSLPRPVVTYSVQAGNVTLTGWGFASNSPIVVSYHHDLLVARVLSGADGSATVSFPLPPWTRARYRVTVTDGDGNYASLIGLPQPRVAFTVKAGIVTVVGSGMAANSPVTVTYHGQRVAASRVDRNGTMSVSFPLPQGSRPRFRLIVSDDGGVYASLTGLPRS